MIKQPVLFPFFFPRALRCFFVLLLLSCSQEQTIPLKARVTGVKDGDTIELLRENKIFTVRLAHIDCPEKNQPFGTRARQFTSAQCFGQTVQILPTGEKDRWGRMIAEIINEKGDTVNRELLKAGLAWFFSRYSSNGSYAALEKTARLQKTGLWSQPDPVAPWEWRNKKRRQ